MAAPSSRRIVRTASVRPPIDVDYLAKQTLGDRGLEQEVLRLFDVMVQTYMERLEASSVVDALLQNLHTLKGAAAGVGAFKLSEMARELETSLKAGEAVDPERIDDIRMAIEEVSVFIESRLGTGA